MEFIVYNIDEIKKYLKQNLSEFRYNHSLMVADEAKKLAEHYNVNSEKAYVAGLVHDIAKEFSDEENLQCIQKYNLSETLLDESIKPIIHADIGAEFIQDMYNFDDEICNSVRYHAIGNFPMTMLEKIIFVADKIARKNPDELLKKEQKLAYTDLDLVLLMCLEYSKNKLEKYGKSLQPVTLKLLQSLQEKYN